jgi:malate dehydrogenase (oxaloacetate-decarboxylating)
MKMAAVFAIANLIPDTELSPDYILPSALDTRVSIAVSKAVGLKAIEEGIAKNILTG